MSNSRHDQNDAQFDQPECDKSGGKGRKNKNSGLSHRQQSILPTVALSPSVSEAARTAGVSESTLYRWMEDPAFREELDRMRQEAAHLARSQIMGLLPRAVEVLAELLNHPDAALRLRAARDILSIAHRSVELQKLQSDIRQMRDLLGPLEERICPN